MNESTAVYSHPDDRQLDLLRAGLLDDMAQDKASLLLHLEECLDCRNRAAHWNAIARTESSADDALSRELRKRRRLAIQGQQSTRTRQHATMRLAFAGIAAGLILALGTVIGLQVWRAPVPAQNVAQADSVPDLYSDIDFYLWVSHEGAQNVGHENQS
ncbi:MAG: hypothetical protein ACYDDO_10250 [Acidiferrobacterales bacterium]